ncbi:MAG: DUF882 domain-containing protein [Syntrophobacteraceae bacterium]|nr:DUF882 domain-containing protein [Syntrophobacteraceae bacterium]
MTRRDLLKMTVLAVQPLIWIPSDEIEAAVAEKHCTGRLTLHNRNTGESIAVRYLDKKGRFDQNACARLNRFFRCHHTGTICRINPKLFVLLDSVRCRLGARERPYVLYSGYRSPEYNRVLKAEDPDVAKKSFHTRGMAADIAIEGVSLRDIRRSAKALKKGGVGIYDCFVHLDVGPVRHW